MISDRLGTVYVDCDTGLFVRLLVQLNATARQCVCVPPTGVKLT